MTDKETFTLTECHITLLRASYVRWDDCEYGAAAIDSKRPYGNSGVLTDLRELFADSGLTDAELETMHKETATALQVVLASGSFEAGVYESSPYQADWHRVEQKP